MELVAVLSWESHRQPVLPGRQRGAPRQEWRISPPKSPTSQVWARRLMAELLRPNMTAKKELRFFCSLRL